MLQRATDPSWTRLALSRFDEVLVDQWFVAGSPLGGSTDVEQPD